jgi:hypothetical protein
MVKHLFRFDHFPDEFQCPDDFSDRSTLLMTIGKTRVFDSLIVQAQKIGIISKYHPLLGSAKSDVVVVVGASQAGVDCRGHVDAPSS